MPLYNSDLYKEINQVVEGTSEYIREYYVPLADLSLIHISEPTRP